jgi:hypothetical protein
MKRNLHISLFCAVLLSSCASLNPYQRTSAHMLRHYNAIFCWAPSDAKDDATSCQNDRAAPSLASCVEELRPTATFFTGEEAARQNLSLCMQGKGWQLLLIDGVMLFGVRPNYSFKRTAATGCATIMRRSAAAA